MFGRLSGIARRVDTLAVKVGQGYARTCTTCFGSGEVVRFFDSHKELDAAAGWDAPAACGCGRAVSYRAIVFVTI